MPYEIKKILEIYIVDEDGNIQPTEVAKKYVEKFCNFEEEKSTIQSRMKMKQTKSL